MKSLRKVISTLLMVAMICSVVAYAAPNVKVTRANGSIAGVSFTCDLDQSSGKVVYDASITAVPGASSVYVATVIQRLSNGSWVNVPGTFLSKSANSQYALVGDTKYVEKGYWYRTQSTFIAYKDGVQTKTVEESRTTLYN